MDYYVTFALNALNALNDPNEHNEQNDPNALNDPNAHNLSHEIHSVTVETYFIGTINNALNAPNDLIQTRRKNEIKKVD
jgi:hypothetical protein